MELNENKTPAPEISALSSSSVAEAESTQSNEDKQLQEEIAQWRQRLTALKNNENYEDKVMLLNIINRKHLQLQDSGLIMFCALNVHDVWLSMESIFETGCLLFFFL